MVKSYTVYSNFKVKEKNVVFPSIGSTNICCLYPKGMPLLNASILKYLILLWLSLAHPFSYYSFSYPAKPIKSISVQSVRVFHVTKL